MVANGIRDGLVLAIGQRVVTADQALKFRELANHLADQIGLAETRGGTGLIPIRARHMTRDIRRQRLEPVNLFVEGAELGVENHGSQRRSPAGQGVAAVLVPEEAGIGQPCAQHALVPRNHGRTAIGGIDIRHDHEAGRQGTVRILNREVFLVGPHRRGKHFGRQIHEAVVNPPHQRHGPFDQPRDLVEQARIRGHGQAFGPRPGARALENRGLALLAIEHDEGGVQFISIIFEG